MIAVILIFVMIRFANKFVGELGVVQTTPPKISLLNEESHLAGGDLIVVY